MYRSTTRPMRLAAVAASVLCFGMAGCDAASQRDPSSTPSTAAVAATPPTAGRSGYAPVQGGRIHYLVYGDLASGRTPLVVLHGTFMSAEMMAPMIRYFAGGRPVIAIDARGHGATGELPGPTTYDLMADDTAAVLTALSVPSADVLGYSMGGTTAVALAVRHPERVRRMVLVSAPAARDGYYPEIVRGLSQMAPQALAGTRMEAEYRSLSPTPDAFPTLVAEMREMESQPYAWPEDRLRSLPHPTLIVVGDADGVRFEHALEFFRLRGGGDPREAIQGFLGRSPRARLAVLPGTSHIGMYERGEWLAAITIPFLDDTPPPMGPSFTGPAQQPSTPPAPPPASNTRSPS